LPVNSDQPGSEFKTLLLRIASAFLILITAGTVGYVTVEGWGFFDALYMVIITITTTGYGEVNPLSTAGRILSMVLMITGIGIFFYGLNEIIPALVGRRLERWKTVLQNIEDHYLLCGFGDMGQEITGELSEVTGGSGFVVIDPDQSKVSLAREKDYLAIQGEPSNEETLVEARVKHAKAILAAMDDSSNAFTIMVAKDLNPDIYAVGVAQSVTGTKNIKRAGADYVLSPYVDTAKKASMLLRNPIAADLSEIVSEIAEVGMLQKVPIKNSDVSGQSLRELDLRAKTGSVIIVIEREGEIIRPTPKSTLQEGDNLYMIGDEVELKAARSILVQEEPGEAN
jgi:voltage-gated potassium channel